MKEKIEVDIVNYEFQRKEAVLKNKKYARIEVIVGDNEQPIVEIELKDIGTIELTALILTTKSALKELEKNYPEVEKIKKLMTIQNEGNYEIKENK